LHSRLIRWCLDIFFILQSYPLQKKHTTMEFLRTLPHLRARSNTFGAVLRMRSAASQSIHSYFQVLHSRRVKFCRYPSQSMTLLFRNKDFWMYTLR
jgi:hypothetical protein